MRPVASWSTLLRSTVLASVVALPIAACGTAENDPKAPGDETSSSPGADASSSGDLPSSSSSGDASTFPVDAGTLIVPFLCEARSQNDRYGYAPSEAAQAFVATLKTQLGVDWLSIRTVSGEDDAGVIDDHAVGAQCTTATDAAACAAAVQALPRPTAQLFAYVGGPSTIQYSDLVAIKGDVVTRIGTREELLAWLGPIDSPAKAWLVAVQQRYRPLCDAGGWFRAEEDSVVVLTERTIGDCPVQWASVLLRIHHDGTIEELQRLDHPAESGCAGRRPEGFALAGTPSRTELGAHFARMAQLEAASVTAFQNLAQELLVHNAPASLIRAAERAARDEIRHARATRVLARRFGALAANPPFVPPALPRSLEALAIENAREGCVREAYGALEATWQAQFAEEPEVRRVLARIAVDEARHAAWSWKLAEWLDTKLDTAAKGRVQHALDTALGELTGARAEPAVSLRRIGGLPSAERAADLATRLEVVLRAA